MITLASAAPVSVARTRSPAPSAVGADVSCSPAQTVSGRRVLDLASRRRLPDPPEHVQHHALDRDRSMRSIRGGDHEAYGGIIRSAGASPIVEESRPPG